MSGGPLFPFSICPVTHDRTFYYLYTTASVTGMQEINGMGVQASVGADSIWGLIWQLPPSTLPTGTLTLNLLAQASAVAGNAKVNAKWAAISTGVDPGATSLSAEGVSTLTWAAGDTDKIKILTITLDAATAPTAGQMIVMNLTFETSSWTLAALSCWNAYLTWI
jgi:hypothetical protein